MQEDKLRDFLELTLTSCMNFLKARSGSIFLFDDKRQELVLKIARNSRKRCLEGIRQRLGEGISGLVASKGKPILVKDIRKDFCVPNRRRFNHYRTDSFISVPLILKDRLIGVININEKASEEAFNSKDLQLISFFSDYIAIVIYNMRYKTKPLKKKEKSVLSQNELEKFASFGKLVAGIAHEFNNPLDGIIRYVNLSLECLPEEGIVREYLLNAKKGLNRIAGIIRSLLDFAQSFSPVVDRSIDVNKAIEDSLVMASHYILSKNIKVIKQFSPHLPMASDNGLKLVFANIIKNACDAMPKDGTLKISTGTIDGFIEIKFTDTGTGVPKEIRDRIFEPFFTTKEIGKGSGLGLAICYDIIQRYNGKIFLEDSKEKKTTFTIQLPMNRTNQEGGK